MAIPLKHTANTQIEYLLNHSEYSLAMDFYFSFPKDAKVFNWPLIEYNYNKRVRDRNMDLLNTLERAVGVEHLSNLNSLFPDGQNDEKQVDTTKIVLIRDEHQPNSNKIVHCKQIHA